MKNRKNWFNTMNELKDSVHAWLKDVRWATRRQLQLKFGCAQPELEENRTRVWRLAAAIAGLEYDGHITKFGDEYTIRTQ